MGRADSPLRDRVIFVQGAPRSGTTWLQMLLATHPQIAGVEAESHLFEFGVDRLFDNFEGRRRHLRGLRAYVERDELVDLVRDLCDGLFLAMRSHVGAASASDFVVEKTPTSAPQGSLDLVRKRECYPDGWYIHVVRDGDAVTRSLMRAPWMADRSEAACRRLWEDCVGYTRERLGDSPRYREVGYEEMRDDPAAVCGQLFQWLGVDAGEEILETVRTLSRERFSDLFADVPAAGGTRRATDATRALARRARDLVNRDVARGGDRAADPLAFEFVRAMRERDEEALHSLTTDSLVVAYRSATGDISVNGDEARRVLVEIAHSTFDRHHVREWWAAVGAAPREWWTRAPGKPFSAVFFSSIDGDASRVDLAFGLTPQDDLIDDVLVITSGPLGGRPTRRLDGVSAAGR